MIRNELAENRKLIGASDSSCCLCLQEKKLHVSHILPKFAYVWLKKTSTTGFFRGGDKPGNRLQDGIKGLMFCSECEGIFSKCEQKFSSLVFYPYVEKELDKNGVAQCIFKSFEYEDWLLKFCISLQYRSILFSLPANEITRESLSMITRELQMWRKYLLGESNETGSTRSNLVFLQNLAFGDGYFKGLHPKAASYSLRAIDTTCVFEELEIVFSFVKLGPVVFFTNIKPTRAKDMYDTQIHLRGTFETATSIKDTRYSHFIFTVRPGEVFEHVTPSDKVTSRVEKAIKENPEKAKSSMTSVAQDADAIMRIKASRHKNRVRIK